LVLRGSERLGPNGLSGAGHTRRRHGTNDIGNATNGSSGEAEKTHTKSETGDGRGQTTRSCRGKRVTAVEMAVQATAVMSDDSSNGGASSAGRDKEIGGGGNE
jgi:hypothetical protein